MRFSSPFEFIPTGHPDGSSRRVIPTSQPRTGRAFSGYRLTYADILARMNTTLSAALAKVTLPDTEGQQVELGSLWHEKPTILVFLRHYG